MIAVALGLLGLVVMIATGVAASSTGGDHLTFLGVGVQTTTAQVFMTGAIFGWVFVIALWLLRVGIHRSGERCAQLARRRSQRASEWLGFGRAKAKAEQDGDGWGGWDEWGGLGRRAGSAGIEGSAGIAGSDGRGVRAGAGKVADLRRPQAGGMGPRPALLDSDAAQRTRIVGRTGATGDRRGAPGRAEGGADQAYRSVAGATEQRGPVRGGHAVGPVAGGLAGVGVGGGAEGGQVGNGSGAMAGEDGRSEGEGGSGEGCQ